MATSIKIDGFVTKNIEDLRELEFFRIHNAGIFMKISTKEANCVCMFTEDREYSNGLSYSFDSRLLVYPLNTEISLKYHVKE